MKVRFKYLLAIAMTAIATFSGPTFAHKKFYVGVEDIVYYPHYSYEEETGYRGVYKSILDKFAEQKGYKFIYVAYPIERLYSALLDNSIDFKYPDDPKWKSHYKAGKRIVYSEPVVSYTDGIMVLPRNKGKGLDTLKSLAIPRGFTPVAVLDEVDSGKIAVAKKNSFSALIKMVMDGEVDGAYINEAVGRYQLKTRFFAPNGLVFDKSLPHTVDGYRLSTLHHGQIVQEFNQFLIDEEESINAIKEEFGLK